MIGLAVAALVFSGMASAQENQVDPGTTASQSGRQWEEIERDEDKRISFDRASIERGEGRFRYTGRTLLPRPDENGVIEIHHRGEIRCASKKFRIISLEAYAPDGGVVASFTAPDSEKPKPIGPNTPNDKLHSLFCS